MRVWRLAALALPLLLGGCALLGGRSASAPAPAVSAPAASPPLAARTAATTDARGVVVTLTLRNTGLQEVRVRYGAQVNWGACGSPPYVALTRADGGPVPVPSAGGRLTCLDVLLTQFLAPGETLTLRRTLPSPGPGTYRLTAWFDGQVNGEPARVQTPPITLEVR